MEIEITATIIGLLITLLITIYAIEFCNVIIQLSTYNGNSKLLSELAVELIPFYQTTIYIKKTFKNIKSTQNIIKYNRLVKQYDNEKFYKTLINIYVFHSHEQFVKEHCTFAHMDSETFLNELNKIEINDSHSTIKGYYESKVLESINSKL